MTDYADWGVPAAIAALLSGQGVPPFVAGMKTVSATQATPLVSPITMLTAPADSRLWAIMLSFAVSTNSAYATQDGPFAQLKIGTVVLLTCQLAANGPGQGLSSDQALNGYGLPLLAGQQLVLNVNNGTSITNMFIRAAAVALYTTP